MFAPYMLAVYECVCVCVLAIAGAVLARSLYTRYTHNHNEHSEHCSRYHYSDKHYTRCRLVRHTNSHTHDNDNNNSDPTARGCRAVRS